MNNVNTGVLTILRKNQILLISVKIKFPVDEAKKTNYVH